MHKNLKTILFIAGAFVGVATLLAVQSLSGYESVTKVLSGKTESEVFRNYGLLAVGLVGVVAALIRLSYTDTQQRQDKRSDLFERFRKSSEMLDSKNMAVRQAAIYTLAEIAKEQPAEFYIIVQSLFCGFLRHASAEQKQLCSDWEWTLKSHVARAPVWPPVRADMQDAISMFSQLRKVVPNSGQIEESAKYRPELAGLFVAGGTFVGVDFSNSNFEQSIFCDTKLTAIIFNNCDLNGVNLDRAIIRGCEMTNCRFGKMFLRWSQITASALTGRVDGWVDFTGALAIAFDYSVEEGRGTIPFASLAKFGVSQPPFKNETEQVFARIDVIERENLAEQEEISARSETE